MPLSPKHQRYFLVAVLCCIVSFQWWHRSSHYAVDEHYLKRAAPVTPSDLQQGITSKPKENGRRLRATMVTLCDYSDLYTVVEMIQSVEDRFNNKYHYDWVFISEMVLTTEFKQVTSNLVSGKVSYGYVNRSEWSFPKFVDPEKSYADRFEMTNEVSNADDLHKRHQQRYLSSFLMNHPLMQDYDYFWRLDAHVKLTCDINYDPFQLMSKNGKKYGFGASQRGDDKRNPSLFTTAAEYIDIKGEDIIKGNKKFIEMDYDNLDIKATGHCEFYTSWEIGDLRFFRSQEYLDFFNHLDQTGGFYHELWTVSAIRSVITSSLLPSSQMHWFSDIGFTTEDLSVCPLEKSVRLDNKCTCNPSKSVSWNPKKYCMHKYFLINDLERPDGWKERLNRDL